MKHSTYLDRIMYEKDLVCAHHIYYDDSYLPNFHLHRSNST